MKLNGLQLMHKINSEKVSDKTTKKVLKENMTTKKLTTKDKAGHNMITLAAARDKLKTLKYLIGVGCDINYIQPNGDNALSVAIYYGNYEVAKYLIEKGLKLADIEHLDPSKVEMFKSVYPSSTEPRREPGSHRPPQGYVIDTIRKVFPDF